MSAPRPRIVILGAGPTGLGAAWRLHRAGFDNWVLYEKDGGQPPEHRERPEDDEARLVRQPKPVPAVPHRADSRGCVRKISLDGTV